MSEATLFRLFYMGAIASKTGYSAEVLAALVHKVRCCSDEAPTTEDWDVVKDFLRTTSMGVKDWIGSESDIAVEWRQ